SVQIEAIPWRERLTQLPSPIDMRLRGRIVNRRPEDPCHSHVRKGEFRVQFDRLLVEVDCFLPAPVRFCFLSKRIRFERIEILGSDFRQWDRVLVYVLERLSELLTQCCRDLIYR